MRALIIDDDLMARTALERLVNKDERLELVGVCEDAESALAFFQKEPDVAELLFLDVEMPGMSGIELLDRIPVLPLIVFTTSNADYAAEAFEYQAIDFLKKPIAMPRFEQAVDRVMAFVGKREAYKERANEIFVREDGRLVRIACDDILYFENVGDYIRIKTVAGQHIFHVTLKGVDEKLNDPRFLKVHRTFIVNLSKIKDIEEHNLVIERTVIPISRANKGELLNRLKIL
jgi:DNA-binding LytR/AlgR family response regulator